MHPIPLTATLSVAPQISEADVAALARQGFRTIINNRPDGEATDQPSSRDLAAAAAKEGLGYVELPVTPGLFEDAQAAQLARVLAESPGPQLAFCRTGTRSTTLWALAVAREGMPVDEILARAAKAGYDLSALRPRLLASAA